VKEPDTGFTSDFLSFIDMWNLFGSFTEPFSYHRKVIRQTVPFCRSGLEKEKARSAIPNVSQRQTNYNLWLNPPRPGVGETGQTAANPATTVKSPPPPYEQAAGYTASVLAVFNRTAVSAALPTPRA